MELVIGSWDGVDSIKPERCSFFIINRIIIMGRTRISGKAID